jgi:hypothetical protein
MRSSIAVLQCAAVLSVLVVCTSAFVPHGMANPRSLFAGGGGPRRRAWSPLAPAAGFLHAHKRKRAPVLRGRSEEPRNAALCECLFVLVRASLYARLATAMSPSTWGRERAAEGASSGPALARTWLLSSLRGV